MSPIRRTILTSQGIILVLVFAGAVSSLNTNAGDTSVNHQAATSIQPGSNFRGEIAAGSTSTFELSLTAGTLLQFSIDKGDLGLRTVLYGPSGSRLLEHVSQEVELVELSVPIETSGTYKLELTSREKTGTRSFDLRVAPSSSITATKRKMSEAQQLSSQAEVLKTDWTTSSLLEAINRYNAAGKILSSIGDLKSASRVALKTGDVFFLLCRYPEALNQYKNAGSLAGKYGDWLGKANADSAIARVHLYVGDLRSAEKYLDQALAQFKLREASLDSLQRRAYAEVFNNLGELDHAKGNFKRALADFEFARNSAEGDRRILARLHLFNAYITGSLGQLDRAITEVTDSVELYSATNDRVGEARARTTLGLSYMEKGMPAQALELHKAALEIFSAVGDRHSEAVTLNAIGQAYERLSQSEMAADRYDEAARIFESIHALDGVSVSLSSAARLYAQKKEWDKSLDYYERALSLSDTAGQRRTSAYIQSEMAQVYMDQARYDLALKKFQQLIRFYESLHDKRGQAKTRNGLGNLLLVMGRNDAALAEFRQALPLSREIGDPAIITTTLYNLARASQVLGHLDEALALVNESIQWIEKLRAEIEGPDFRVSYFSGVQQNYDLCVNILMELDRRHPDQGFATKALLVRNDSHSRLLRDLVGEPNVDSQPGVTRELLERKNDLRRRWRALGRYSQVLSADKSRASDSSELDAELRTLRADYQEVETRLREQNPRLAIDVGPPLDLRQIQAQLQDDDLLLEYFLGDQRSYLWAVTRSSIQSYELPNRQDIEDAAVALLKSISARQETSVQELDESQIMVQEADKRWPEQAAILGQILWTPVAAALHKRRLLVVPDGALQSVPFDLLPLPGSNSAAIDTHEIVILPSFSTLVAVRNRTKQPLDRSKLVAVLADPVYGPNDDRVLRSQQTASNDQAATRSLDVCNSIPLRLCGESGLHDQQKAGLPQRRRDREFTQRSTTFRDAGFSRLIHSSEEADAIARTVPAGTATVIKGFAATRESAMNVRSFQVVHFATHGFLDSEHPDLSGVALTMVDPSGREVDGLMLMKDVYTMDLSAELTVLSACQTALGKDTKGEGTIGLGHAFMSAGSKSVVASLWKVDDRATAELMGHFYESMMQDGLTPAAALRAAKLKLRHDPRWSPPYYWAGFVLQGEYANHIVVEHKVWSKGSLILLLLIFVAGSIFVLVARSRRREQRVTKAGNNA